MPEVMTLHESIIGCIVGGAIGDAIGVPYEGIKPGINLTGDLAPDRLSDDTQMTLATCEAIVQSGVDPETIAKTFSEWYQADRFSGIGASTYAALDALANGAHWAIAGRTGEYAAGNGAAMRIAPLAYHVDLEDRQTIRDVVRITHHNDDAYVGALAVLHAISLRDQLDHRIIAKLSLELPDTAVRDRLQIYADSERKISDIGAKLGASGYVVDSVPLAIYAASKVHVLGFERMIRELILAGGDTDTTCSIAGQIAGSAIGHCGLPQHFIAALPDRELIYTVAERFSEVTQEATESNRIRDS